MRAIRNHQAPSAVYTTSVVAKVHTKSRTEQKLAVNAKDLSRAIYVKADGFSRDAALKAFSGVKRKER